MTTYRQILTLSSRSLQARDVDALHRLIMAGYRHALDGSHPDARARLNVLYLAARTPTNPYDHNKPWPPKATPAGRVLVQANTPGDWQNTEYAHHHNLDLHVSEPITVNTTLTPGQHLQLKVTLNPTRSLPSPTNPGAKRARGRRVPITDASEVGEWAQRVFGAHGLALDLDGTAVSAPSRLVGHKPSGQTVTVDVRTLTTTATVADAQAASALLVEGVGRGKAWGAGLIRHRPID